MGSKKKLMLFLMTLGFSGLFVEVVARWLTKSSLSPKTQFILARYQRHKVSLFRFDDELGWRNQENVSFSDVKSRPLGIRNVNRYFTVSIDSNGFRQSPNNWRVKLNLAARPILAIGDSFTFGDEVTDDETWPNHLQAIKKVKVLNGGVISYGLDQIYLKLLREVSVVKPSTIVLSAMANTLIRTTLTHKISSPFCDTREKPFFVKRNGNFEVRAVLGERNSQNSKLDVIRSVLGHSFIFDTLFNSWFRRFWNCAPREMDYPSALRTQYDHREVSCWILERIFELARDNRAKLLVIGQAYWNPKEDEYHLDEDVESFLKCATELKIPNVNVDRILKRIFDENPYKYQSLFFPGTHMTNQGNFMVAQEIDRVLH